MRHLMELNHIYKQFGGLKAVNDVDLILEEGEILGLIGPNGSGKTTLFNLIAGVIKPDRGTIRFEGKDVTGSSAASTCQMGIARTFQVTRPFSLLTVLDNVKVARAYGCKPAITFKQAQTEAEDVLRFIGLLPECKVISGRLGLIGRKRLELAKALATRPKVLLLDETMAGLNLTEVQTTINLVRRIRDSGISVIVIEHMMKAILGMCDRIIVLDSGRKIADGLPHDVMRNKQVVAAYLGVDEHAED